MIAEAKNLEVKEIKLTDRPKYTKKDLVADHPTWCPGCGRLQHPLHLFQDDGEAAGTT